MSSLFVQIALLMLAFSNVALAGPCDGGNKFRDAIAACHQGCTNKLKSDDDVKKEFDKLTAGSDDQSFSVKNDDVASLAKMERAKAGQAGAACEKPYKEAKKQWENIRQSYSMSNECGPQMNRLKTFFERRCERNYEKRMADVGKVLSDLNRRDQAGKDLKRKTSETGGGQQSSANGGKDGKGQDGKKDGKGGGMEGLAQAAAAAGAAMAAKPSPTPEPTPDPDAEADAEALREARELEEKERREAEAKEQRDAWAAQATSSGCNVNFMVCSSNLTDQSCSNQQKAAFECCSIKDPQTNNLLYNTAENRSFCESHQVSYQRQVANMQSGVGGGFGIPSDGIAANAPSTDVGSGNGNTNGMNQAPLPTPAPRNTGSVGSDVAAGGNVGGSIPAPFARQIKPRGKAKRRLIGTTTHNNFGAVSKIMCREYRKGQLIGTNGYGCAR